MGNRWLSILRRVSLFRRVTAAFHFANDPIATRPVRNILSPLHTTEILLALLTTLDPGSVLRSRNAVGQNYCPAGARAELNTASFRSSLLPLAFALGSIVAGLGVLFAGQPQLSSLFIVVTGSPTLKGEAIHVT